MTSLFHRDAVCLHSRSGWDKLRVQCTYQEVRAAQVSAASVP